MSSAPPARAKSRLTEEFLARVEGARVRQGRCLPYGEGITLWPIQLIRAPGRLSARGH